MTAQSLWLVECGFKEGLALDVEEISGFLIVESSLLAIRADLPRFPRRGNGDFLGAGIGLGSVRSMTTGWFSGWRFGTRLWAKSCRLFGFGSKEQFLQPLDRSSLLPQLGMELSEEFAPLLSKLKIFFSDLIADPIQEPLDLLGIDVDGRFHQACKFLCQCLPTGYTQWVLMGRFCSLVRHFVPRPFVSPSSIQLAAL